MGLPDLVVWWAAARAEARARRAEEAPRPSHVAAGIKCRRVVVRAGGLVADPIKRLMGSTRAIVAAVDFEFAPGADLRVGVCGGQSAGPSLPFAGSSGLAQVRARNPELAAEASEEFFLGSLANQHTRKSYTQAVARFCRWCFEQNLALEDLRPTAVARYLEERQREVSLATVKLHAAAVGRWLGWLTQRGVLPMNPAANVRTPRLNVVDGKSVVLERGEARRLLEHIAGLGTLRGKRDAALIGLMIFNFLRVSEALSLRLRDLERDASALSAGNLRVRAKGGKERRLPCHHRVAVFLADYMAAAGLESGDRGGVLFQSIVRRVPCESGVRGARAVEVLTGRQLQRRNALCAVKLHCRAAGLSSSVSNHSFRATGITIHQENGGTLEDAARLAGHASTRTTALYNRAAQKLARAEVERVQL